MRVMTFVAACAALQCATAQPPPKSPPDPWNEIVARAERHTGLLDVYVDRTTAKVYLAVPPQGPLGTFLYVDALASGLGSNPVGLDRGQLGETRVVSLRVQGGRLLMEAHNLDFRARTDAAPERRATRESFARSVLWAGDLGPRHSDGRALVDLTSLLIRDAHDVVATLRSTDQGSYKLAPKHSAVDLDGVLAFPDNVVFESTLTYQSTRPGGEVRAVAPTGRAFTVQQRQTFIRLPDDGYTPRRFHPRAGSFAVTFQDYAAPLDQAIRTQFIVRHRLNPGDRLTYYVDPGIPEPVRQAVIDGASWWAEAFAAAGFPDAFEVKLLPADAHPLDVRYNVIQWVHRATRGWSYGYGVIDPRTGEMLKGHVSLGSLRVRQDRLIFEALLGTEKTGSGAPDDPVQLALARIRQLAAHEVGHTLGFAHNFAASTYGRGSVMDYPAPWVRVQKDGGLDVSTAYARGIGVWDIMATRYAYTPFEDEAKGLADILQEAQDKAYVFLSDADARPAGAAHPYANLWDNGADPITALNETMAVRKAAMARFGPDRLSKGAPLAALEEVFAPLFFYHRYQLTAATKMIGGMTYAYTMAGEPGSTVAIPVADQRRALQAILQTMTPAALDVPEHILAHLVPRALGLTSSREQFATRTSPAFDALGAARTGADVALRGLLQRERAARLIDQQRRDLRQLGFTEVLDAIVSASFGRAPRAARAAAIQREIQHVVVGRLLMAAADKGAAESVRAEATAALRRLERRLRGRDAHQSYLRARIERYLQRPAEPIEAPPVPRIPPGSPIGCASEHRSTQPW